MEEVALQVCNQENENFCDWEAEYEYSYIYPWTENKTLAASIEYWLK